ncbi:MAG: sigma 54-interacting transcriptional regulator [Polyangiaceae bacterium]|nr:sigma 54-interacting transcriptional regulator [Polyangiaceae bacterium]
MDKPPKLPLEPDDIRSLRGERTRAAFAALLGVTPLTVYRWELPVDSAQARRPRGKVAARLVALAQGHEPTRPEKPGLDAAEQRELLPLLERVASDELRRVENELVALMASGRLRTRAARALATQALARTVLFLRADTCGAFAAIAPLLSELPELPGFVELELHVTAAALFSWPDGRFFDAGKVHAHLALAERLLQSFGTPEARLLLAVVRAAVALAVGEAELLPGVLPQGAEVGQARAAPLLRTLLLEAEGFVAVASGRRGAAARAFEEVAERGAIAVSRVRALAELALLSIQDARAPHEALGLVERARVLALQARLQPGLHSLMLDNIEGSALVRLARFAEAERVLENAIDLAAELRYAPAYSALVLAQVYVFTGRAEALGALGERLAAYDGPTAPGITRALGALLVTGSRMHGASHGGADLTAVFERQAEDFVREADWGDIRSDGLLAIASMTARAGTPERAERALRRAERHLERFPSIWATSVLRRAKGLLLVRQGRLSEGRQLIESALGTLTLAEDVGNAALARFELAAIDRALGEPGAPERIERCRAELERLGVVLDAVTDLQLSSPGEAPAPRPAAGGVATPRAATVARLVVPLQRLAVRGMSSALIERELVTLVAEQLPGVAVELEEVDSAGRTTPLVRTGPAAGGALVCVELGDGAGRRLRLGAGGPSVDSEARALLTALASVAELALELAALRSLGSQRASPSAAGQAGDLPEIPGFISVSAPMRQLKADLVRLSRSRSTVIISGESGSGKEVLARAIHDLSTRARAPYVAFNCAAVPRDLFEGQLFGYRRGAFTGAAADQPGVLRAAEGGTVLLDEIGELPLDVQPSSCASSKMARSSRSASASPSCSTCASSPPPSATWRSSCASTASGRISSTGCRSSRSRCRPCASGPTTSSRSPAISSRSSRPQVRSRRSWRRTRSRCSTPTAGRATCASCATRSSVRSRSSRCRRCSARRT